MKEAVFLLNQRAARNAAAGLQTINLFVIKFVRAAIRTLEPSASGLSRRAEVSAGVLTAECHPHIMVFRPLMLAGCFHHLTPRPRVAVRPKKKCSRVVAVTEGE